MTKSTAPDVVAEMLKAEEAPSYTPSELKAKIRRHLRADLPLIITSSPGAGKTEIGHQAAEAEDFHVWRGGIHPSHYSNLDMVGLPWSCKELPTFEFKRSPLWPDPLDSRRILIFIDEITNCPPESQHVLLRLLGEKRIFEQPFGANVRIIAAGNGEGDRTFSNKLSTAMCNRVAHAHLTINNEEWLAHATAKNLDPMITSFIRAFPSLLSTFKPDSMERAFASPRSWFKLDCELQTNGGPGSINDIASWVGQGVAREFHAFFALRESLISLEEVLANPKKARLPDESRRDLLFATIGTLSRAARPENIDSLYLYIQRLPCSYGTLFIIDAVRACQDLVTTSAFHSWCSTFGADLFARKT